ncbi:major facilitator superfamily domain-containing protein [Neohortaea acidophila]|uniref:Major facilitator superfamily domain-containing protein n=1 Tax=Neohortaea acidophila TaxID=245834 RepID=A0A6A6Q0J2_9PEZI|nr:major facilitator superfamily domain-containing protein [Neohortaea acidophila]KAF2485499.1 major facilitator superfamily domain-containing protein [Neohortaea acidophila]
MSHRHQHTLSQSTARSEDVDSAASTYVASAESSKFPSLDEARREAGPDGRRHYDDISDDGEDDLDLQELDPLVLHPNEQDEAPPPPQDAVAVKEKPVSWSQLPRKSQLTILTLARLSEPLAQTSLQSYVFYQLKSFKLPDGSSPSDETVARQAGMLAAAFTGAQFTTAMFWGRMADWERMGRKRVLLVGLIGVAIGSLGFGFSQTFLQAVVWRCVGGLLNGNIGVMRTMISEIIREKKYQSRAFLLLPMTFNAGVIVGPLMGGLLADPVGNYPGLFGPGSALGGEDGVYWLTRWPYALPNVVNACFLLVSALALVLGLQETHYALKDRPDYGLRLSRWVGSTIFRIKPKQDYLAVNKHDPSEAVDIERTAKTPKPAIRRQLPIRRIWTANVLCALLSHGLLAVHIGTFSNLWFVFLSTSRYDPSTSASHPTPRATDDPPNHYRPHLPFQFTGGLALPPPSIGTALAILGVIGLSLQLLLYPRLSFRLGTIRSLRYALCLFPISYALVPYLSIIPSTRPPPGPASGALVWIGITLILCVQVMGRTFALPANAILVNNSNPHPSVLGTFHGIAQSISAAMRTLGPAVAGWIYSIGLQKGIVGLAWWCMAGVAVVGAVAGRFVKDGDGHELWLEGEREELEEENDSART